MKFNSLKRITVLLLAFNFINTSQSKTLIVDELGNGGYTTIREAVAAAANGDVILIRPGNYSGAVIDRDLNLVGSGPQHTYISGGLEISIPNIFLSVNSLTLSNPLGHGILFKQNGDSNLNVINCIITNCGQNGVDYGSSGGPNFIGSFVIRNSVFNKCENAIFMTEPFNEHGAISVQSCIFTRNQVGMSLHIGTELHDYNLFFDNDTDIEGGSRSENEIVLMDPKFVDIETGNFVLQSDSPAINAGPMTPATLQDPDGTRNDIGAYGGPAVAFWPYIVGGPVISELKVTPTSVPRGGTIQIEARVIVE